MTMVEMACDGAVVRLTMNAPDRLNALSDEMLAALQEQIDALVAATRTAMQDLLAAGPIK